MMSIEAWKEMGAYYSIGKHRLFAVDTGGNKKTLLILHGYPTFSYDYWRVLPELRKYYRVVIHDHLGFGLSDKPVDYSYSLIEQADHAIMLWQKLGVEQAYLFAHDYGTSVATEILARRNMGVEPVKLHSLTLCNGSMHIELAQLRPIQKLLRHKWLGPIVANLTSSAVFKRNMRKLWADPTLLSDEELNAMWKLLLFNNGRKVLPAISCYTLERFHFWHRWIGALQTTDLLVNILWATEDPVAVLKMADVLHHEIPNSRLKLLEGIGHYPMIEAPEKWSQALFRLLKPQ